MAPQDGLKPIGWAADYIAVSPQTLRNWAKAGKVPYVRLPSGQFRFRVTDLDAMVRRVEPAKAAS